MSSSPSLNSGRGFASTHLLSGVSHFDLPTIRSSVMRTFWLGEKMAYSANDDRKIPEGVLLTYCDNLDCLNSFHVVPKNEDDMTFFNELLVDRYARAPARLLLICPQCGAFVEVLASALEVCTCGQEPHSPLYKP